MPLKDGKIETNCINCPYTNTRGMLHNLKIEEIATIAESKVTNIIGLTETWAHEQNLNNEFKITGYNLFRK